MTTGLESLSARKAALQQQLDSLQKQKAETDKKFKSYESELDRVKPKMEIAGQLINIFPLLTKLNSAPLTKKQMNDDICTIASQVQKGDLDKVKKPYRLVTTIEIDEEFQTSKDIFSIVLVIQGMVNQALGFVSKEESKN